MIKTDKAPSIEEVCLLWSSYRANQVMYLDFLSVFFNREDGCMLRSPWEQTNTR